MYFIEISKRIFNIISCQGYDIKNMKRYFKIYNRMVKIKGKMIKVCEDVE